MPIDFGTLFCTENAAIKQPDNQMMVTHNTAPVRMGITSSQSAALKYALNCLASTVYNLMYGKNPYKNSPKNRGEDDRFSIFFSGAYDISFKDENTLAPDSKGLKNVFKKYLSKEIDEEVISSESPFMSFFREIIEHSQQNFI